MCNCVILFLQKSYLTDDQFFLNVTNLRRLMPSSNKKNIQGLTTPMWDTCPKIWGRLSKIFGSGAYFKIPSPLSYYPFKGRQWEIRGTEF